MNGIGILKGLSVTFKHFIETYVDDIRYGGRKYLGTENFEVRQGMKAQGAFTVQYPEEKIAVPERFRFVPFLVVNDPDHPDAPGKDWCTSCGICSKVCPPQCIWIVRSEDPVTNRPVPEPEAFFIDIDICMNCGYCAEFCPFDAIKMDHDYEMADYDRTGTHIHDKPKLSKPYEYWYNLAPTTAAEEAEDRGGWEHTDVIKAKKKSGEPLMEKPWFMMRTEDPEARARAEAERAARAAAAAESTVSEADIAAERHARRVEALARHRNWLSKKN